MHLLEPVHPNPHDGEGYERAMDRGRSLTLDEALALATGGQPRTP